MTVNTTSLSPKNSNILISEIDKRIDSKVSNLTIPKIYFGIVTNVYSDGNFADVELSYGEDTLLIHISNRSNVVLNVGDSVVLTAPTNNLSSIYIDKSKTDTPTFDGAKIIGQIQIGGINNQNGTVLIKGATDDDIGLILHDHYLDVYDYLKTNYKIGSIGAFRVEDDSGAGTGVPMLNIVSEIGCSTAISGRNSDGSTAKTLVEVSNNSYNDGQFTYIHTPLKVEVDNTHELDILPDAQGGNNLYGHINHQGWDINSVGNLHCINLSASGSKNCVQTTKNFGDRLFYSYELTENYLGDPIGGKIVNGTCTIYIDSIVRECINTDINYYVKFYPEESCNYKIINKTSTSFTITADKDITFLCELFGKRIGFEDVRLEYNNNLKQNLTTIYDRQQSLNKKLLDNVNKKNNIVISQLIQQASNNQLVNNLLYNIKRGDN